MIKHRTLAKFWDAYAKLPKDVQKLADKSFQMLMKDSHHSSLKLKKLDTTGDWAVHVGAHYRALGYNDGDAVIWYWIGSHEHYNALFKSRRARSFYDGTLTVDHWTTGEPIRVPVYVDPSPEDVAQVKNIKFPPNIVPYVRFLADKYKRKVYVWHGEIGAYHKDIAQKLNIPYESALKGMARMRSNNTLKATEISGTQRNPADWEWVEQYIQGIADVMART